MNRIDVHIVRKPTEPYLDECLTSLRDEPVNLRFVKYVEGDTAAARMEGFSRGNAPYISFVDPDDMIVPGIFSKLLSVLGEFPQLAGVYTDEILVDAQGAFIMPGWSSNPIPFLRLGYRPGLFQGVHHLRLLRRSAVEQCLPLKTKRYPEPVLMAELMVLGGVVRFPEVGYKWRIYGGNAFLSFTGAEMDEAERHIRGGLR